MTTKSTKDRTYVDHKDWGKGRSVAANPGSGGSRRDLLEYSSLAAASALLAPRQLFAADDGVAKTARTPGETTEATIQRPPLPPFTLETAIQKVRLAEDAWNSRAPEKVALAYTIDSRWRNRSEFVNGRQEIIAFLTRKWAKELVRRAHRAIQRLLLFVLERTSRALWQIAQRQRPDRDTHEPEHFYFQFFEHPPDVAILAFVQHNFEPRMALALPKHADVFHVQKSAVACADSVS